MAEVERKEVKDAGVDAENAESAVFYNSTISEFSWRDVSLTVKDRKTKKPKPLIQNLNGEVHGGKNL